MGWVCETSGGRLASPLCHARVIMRVLSSCNSPAMSLVKKATKKATLWVALAIGSVCRANDLAREPLREGDILERHDGVETAGMRQRPIRFGRE